MRGEVDSTTMQEEGCEVVKPLIQTVLNLTLTHTHTHTHTHTCSLFHPSFILWLYISYYFKFCSLPRERIFFCLFSNEIIYDTLSCSSWEGIGLIPRGAAQRIC